jgi:hypothetical protein
MTNHIPRHPSDQREQPKPAPSIEPPTAGGTPGFDDCHHVYRFDHGRREHAWAVLAVAAALTLAFLYIRVHTFSPYSWLAWLAVVALVIAFPFLLRLRDEDIIGIHTDGLLWRPWLSVRQFVPWYRLVGMDEMILWMKQPAGRFGEMHQLDVLEEMTGGAKKLRRVTLVGTCEQSDGRLRALEQLRDEVITRARLSDCGYQAAAEDTEWGRENAHIRRLAEVNLRRLGKGAAGDLHVRSWRRRTNA